MSTWVVGDIHGCYDKFMKLLGNNKIKDEDTIIIIGDIIDRGPDSYKMLKWAMKNITYDGKYQMICGNHEDNIVWEYDYFLKTLKFHKNVDINSDIDFLNTQYDFTEYMYRAGFETVASVLPIIKWFTTLPLTKEVEVTTPQGNKQKYLIAHAWYFDGIKDEDILWFRDSDHRGNLLEDYKSIDGEILVHGHTPTITIRDCQEKPVNEVLFREHSINIDCGCVFEQYGGNLAAIRLEDQKVIYADEPRKIII